MRKIYPVNSVWIGEPNTSLHLFSARTQRELSPSLELKSRTRLSDFTFTFHCHALEKELATHSSVLAWRIPRTGAWWAAVSGVARSRTRLKRLSSSSSRLWQIVFSQDGWNNISHLMDPYSVNLLFSPKSWNLYLLLLTLGRTLWLLHPMKYKRNEVMWLSRS